MSTATLGNKFIAGFFCLVLAACGGGGGSSTPTAGTGDSSGSGTATTGIPTPSGMDSGQPPSAVGGVSTPPPGNNAGAPQQPVTADATQARFNQPFGIARDSTGNLYVADAGNYTIRKITPSGTVVTLAGSAGASGSADGGGASARFGFLKGLTVDAVGNLYVVDGNAIRRITANGVVTTIAGVPGIQGDTDGPGAVARFTQPWGITADSTGNLYVADTGNLLIRKITPAGDVSTHAGTRGMRGTANGSTGTATFLGPRGIARDPANNLYLTDWLGPPAPMIPEGSTFVRRVGTDGTVSTMAGSFGGEAGGPVFRDTFAIAADAGGNAYVAAMSSVRRVSSSGAITTMAGPVAQFQSLLGAAIDSDGNLYVADNSAHTINRIAPDGTVTLIAGQPGQAGSIDVPTP